MTSALAGHRSVGQSCLSGLSLTSYQAPRRLRLPRVRLVSFLRAGLGTVLAGLFDQPFPNAAIEWR